MDKLNSWRVQSSEGPPRYPGEINERLRRFHLMDDVIFDRHPVVSQSIYAIMRQEPEIISEDLVVDFYKRKPLLIYCDPADRRMTGHVLNEIDTQQHLDQVNSNYDRLLSLYRDWAVRHAHLIYRIGDDMNYIADCVLQREKHQHDRPYTRYRRLP